MSELYVNHELQTNTETECFQAKNGLVCIKWKQTSHFINMSCDEAAKMIIELRKAIRQTELNSRAALKRSKGKL